MAGMIYKKNLIHDFDMCMGTFITEKFILTVAHRVRDGVDKDYFEVFPFVFTRADEPDESKDEAEIKGLPITKIHLYLVFRSVDQAGRFIKKQGNKNNIALVELKEAAEVKPVAIFNMSEYLDPGAKANLVQIEEDPSADKKIRLQSSSVSLVSRDECAKLYKGQYRLRDDQICTVSGKPGPKGSVFLEPGLPLLVNNRQAGILIGYPHVESANVSLRTDVPIVFVSVAYQRHWINALVSELNTEKADIGSVLVIILIIAVSILVALVVSAFLFKNRLNNIDDSRNSER